MHSDTGHRDRVKDRFRREGLDGFAPVHALELILFYAIPQKDTKELARTLLNHFGSYTAVLEASAAELEAVPGVGKNVATYLNLQCLLHTNTLLSAPYPNLHILLHYMPPVYLLFC